MKDDKMTKPATQQYPCFVPASLRADRFEELEGGATPGKPDECTGCADASELCDECEVMRIARMTESERGAND